MVQLVPADNLTTAEIPRCRRHVLQADGAASPKDTQAKDTPPSLWTACSPARLISAEERDKGLAPLDDRS